MAPVLVGSSKQVGAQPHMQMGLLVCLAQVMLQAMPIRGAPPPLCTYGNCSGNMPQCNSSMKLDSWRSRFAEGDRMSYVGRYSCSPDGGVCHDTSLMGKLSGHLRCLVKGAGGVGALDTRAYVDTVVGFARVEFHTKRPCGFYHLDLWGQLEVANGSKQSSNSSNQSSSRGVGIEEDPGRRLGAPLSLASAGQRRLAEDNSTNETADASCSNTDRLAQFYAGEIDEAQQLDATCPYWQLPAGGESVRQRPSGWPAGQKWAWDLQHSFLGPVYAVGEVNGEYPGDDAADANETFNEYAIEFGSAQVGAVWACEERKGSSGSSNPDASGAMYDGGVRITSKRGAYLTTHIYQFKNDAQRDAALAAAAADQTGETNPGLQYAHLVTGAGGCDVEIVFQVKPMSGGGLRMSFSFPLFAYTHERQAPLRSSTAAWVSGSADDANGEAVHVLVGKRALQTAQNLPCASAQPEDAYEEIAVFALTLVCQATGERVTASTEMVLANGTGLPAGQISRNGTAPTPWNLSQAFDPAGQQNEELEFRMTLTAQQAPENCTAMFLDPLIHAPDGDGLEYREVQVQRGGGADEDGSDLGGGRASAPPTGCSCSWLLAVLAVLAAGRSR